MVRPFTVRQVNFADRPGEPAPPCSQVQGISPSAFGATPFTGKRPAGPARNWSGVGTPLGFQMTASARYRCRWASEVLNKEGVGVDGGLVSGLRQHARGARAWSQRKESQNRAEKRQHAHDRVIVRMLSRPSLSDSRHSAAAPSRSGASGASLVRS